MSDEQKSSIRVNSPLPTAQPKGSGAHDSPISTTTAVKEPDRDHSRQDPKDAGTKPAIQPTLLSLPSEIRNVIYIYVFSSTTHVARLTTPHPAYLDRPWEKSLCRGNNLSLLLACSQIYTEAHMLAFSYHTFLVRRDTITTNYDIAICNFEDKLACVTSIAFLCEDLNYAGRNLRSQHLRVTTQRLLTHIMRAVWMARWQGLQNLKHVTFLVARYSAERENYFTGVMKEWRGGDLVTYCPAVARTSHFESEEEWRSLGFSIEKRLVSGAEESALVDPSGYVVTWNESLEGSSVKRRLNIVVRHLPWDTEVNVGD